MGLCQYDRSQFKPAFLLDALGEHPIVVIGTEIFDNYYYVPSKGSLESDNAEAKLGHFFNNLARQKQIDKELTKHI